MEHELTNACLAGVVPDMPFVAVTLIAARNISASFLLGAAQCGVSCTLIDICVHTQEKGITGGPHAPKVTGHEDIHT